MNNDDQNNLHTPIESNEPASTADELLAHGLLTFTHKDPPAETERRVRAVMRRIADEAVTHAPGAKQGERRLLSPHARRWAALAACIAVIAAMVYLGMPTESRVQAMVRSAAASLREPTDRRFDVRIQDRGSKELETKSVGTLDSRGVDLMVFRLQPEEGVWVTFGRDADGPWVVHPDGRSERNPPSMAMPRWGMVEDQEVAPESVDRVLERLASGYTLERKREAETAGGPALDHITGLRKPGTGPGAPRVELWLDPDTNAVKKVELVFPDPPPGPPEGMGGGRGRRGERDGPPPRGPDGQRGPGGPGGRKLPRDAGGLDGPPDELIGEPGDRPHDGPPPMRDRMDGRGPDDHGPGGAGAGGVAGMRGGPGRFFRGGPARVEFRPLPPPPPPPDWFSPKGHAKAV